MPLYNPGTGATVEGSEIADLTITDADVSASAAIAQSKLALAITNAEVAAGAAIAKSKLASLGIVDADVDAAAAIAESKLSLASDAAAGTASRRTLGTGATQAAAGNDSRFYAMTGIWLPIFQFGGIIPSTNVTGALERTWSESGTPTAAGATSSGVRTFYLVGADLAISGKAAKFKVRASAHVNDTAVGTGLRMRLYPVTFAGATANQLVVTLGTAVTGSEVNFGSLAASAEATGTSSSFDPPSDGVYTLGWVSDGAATANTAVNMEGQVLLSYV